MRCKHTKSIYKYTTFRVKIKFYTSLSIARVRESTPTALHKTTASPSASLAKPTEINTKRLIEQSLLGEHRKA